MKRRLSRPFSARGRFGGLFFLGADEDLRTLGVRARRTPTPTNLQRINPDVIEDTPSYTIKRYKKSEYIRVDDRHIRSPIIPLQVEFFKEDDEYYYVYTRQADPRREGSRARGDGGNGAAARSGRLDAEGKRRRPTTACRPRTSRI